MMREHRSDVRRVRELNKRSDDNYFDRTTIIILSDEKPKSIFSTYFTIHNTHSNFLSEAIGTVLRD